MTTIAHDLRLNGFVNVDYPETLRHAVENAVVSWKSFCALPKEEKNAFAFLEDNHGDGAGYELKEAKGDKKDLKENFHVTLFQYDRLAKIANKRTFPFLNDAKTLIDCIEPLIVNFARGIEEDFQVDGLADAVARDKSYWIFRYLHYFSDQQAGTEIAAPHVDKGGFTLHLYESDDGLEYFSMQDRVWKPMPVHSRQTVIIPAAQLQLASKGELKGLYHRVVATDKTAKIGRFSMVCFIPFQHIPMYNKKVYGNMQGHEIGFNYSIEHHEYAQLFIK